MKTTLAFLTAGLIFLAIPMLASADRGHYGDHPKYGQGWDQGDRYTYNQQYRRHDQRKYSQKHNHRVKKAQVREMRQVKRSTGHNHRRTYYAKPAILIGIPPLVLLFGW